MILKCTCVHEAQDEFHGKWKRVHNLMGKGAEARCTVCKTVRATKLVIQDSKAEKKVEE